MKTEKGKKEGGNHGEGEGRADTEGRIKATTEARKGHEVKAGFGKTGTIGGGGGKGRFPFLGEEIFLTLFFRSGKERGQ